MSPDHVVLSLVTRTLRRCLSHWQPLWALLRTRLGRVSQSVSNLVDQVSKLRTLSPFPRPRSRSTELQ